jgi:hypothetical protein
MRAKASGGGYIGSDLSSALLDHKDGLAKGDLPLTSETASSPRRASPRAAFDRPQYVPAAQIDVPDAWLD